MPTPYADSLKSKTLAELANLLRYSGHHETRIIMREFSRRDENAKPRKVWLVLGEHFSVPGLVQKVFATKAGADAEALDLVNLMMRDTEGGKERKRGWEKGLEWLQDYHGEGDCDVAVSELKVEG